MTHEVVNLKYLEHLDLYLRNPSWVKMSLKKDFIFIQFCQAVGFLLIESVVLCVLSSFIMLSDIIYIYPCTSVHQEEI